MGEGKKNCFCGSEIVQGKNLKCGDLVQLNARLVPKSIRVEDSPYLGRALWKSTEKVPAHLFPRMLEPLGRDELMEYKDKVEDLIKKMPSEFEKFLGSPDFEVLGSVLAMQGILPPEDLKKKDQELLS